MPIKQAHIIYQGRVQGVGFRFTAQSLARDLGIKGWVKNLANGDVEIVIQADESVVNNFLDKIRDDFSGYIRNEQLDWLEPSGGFNNFQIRF